jgi:hypothetical protein
MILFPKLSIASLQNFQPFLLNLTPCQIFHYSVVDIFSKIDVWRQWMVIIGHIERKVFVYLVVNSIVPLDFVQPTSWQLVVSFLYLFRSRALILFYLVHHLVHERVFYFHDFSFDLVSELPFALWKHPCFLLEFQLWIQVVFYIIVASFA